MNKLIFFGLLLVLTSQLKLPTHLQDDPLSGKAFTITSNSIEMSELNGINVSFNEGSLFFKGCNGCSTTYSLEDGNFFSVGPWISTLMYCEEDNDELLQALFESSVKYELSGNKLTFYNEAS